MSFEKLAELNVLKQKMKGSSKKKDSLETEGLAIEILKQIPYFKAEAETYGIQVLSYYIPIIEPYMLRAGMQIIDTNEEYVVVQGLVRGTKNDGKLGNLYPEGVLIDPTIQLNKPQPERQSLSSTTEVDTKLIKIFRNSQDPKRMKHSQALAKFQKERISKQREMQRLFTIDKSLQVCKQKMSKFQFFQSLTTYDLVDLIIQSKFVYFKKCCILHQFGAEADRVGFLLNGQVRIDNSVIHNKEKIVEAGRLLLEKYMVHKKQHNSSVVTIAEGGQWIGLEEYLWNQKSFLSRAEVVSHDAEVFYVPFDVFSKKFNELTAFYLMNKLKGLTQTKKKLLDKTIKTKKQKEDEMLEQKMKIQTLQKLQERLERNINSLDSEPNKKKSHKNSKSSSQNFVKKRKNHNFPSQCYMPERLVHKIKTFEQKYESLPKIQQRFTLFPQQYEKAMVPLELREELKMAKQARNPFRKNMNARPFKILSNEKVYETVIYASLSPKESSNPEQEKKKMFSKLKSTISIDNSQDTDIDMLQTIGSMPSTSRQRFNFSIFNNFRAPKNKGQKLLQNISKTLQII